MICYPFLLFFDSADALPSIRKIGSSHVGLFSLNRPAIMKHPYHIRNRCVCYTVTAAAVEGKEFVFL